MLLQLCRVIGKEAWNFSSPSSPFSKTQNVIFFFLLKFQCNAVSCKFLFNYPVRDLRDSWICRLLSFRIKEKKKKSTTTSSVIFAVTLPLYLSLELWWHIQTLLCSSIVMSPLVFVDRSLDNSFQLVFM